MYVHKRINTALIFPHVALVCLVYVTGISGPLMHCRLTLKGLLPVTRTWWLFRQMHSRGKFLYGVEMQETCKSAFSTVIKENLKCSYPLT